MWPDIPGIDAEANRSAARTAAGFCRHCYKPSVPGKKLCRQHHESQRESARRRNQLLRDEVFAAYGGFRCVCCGESTPEFLQIDHVEGGGRLHRLRLAKEGTTFYRWLKRNDFPEGFQVLCANCNLAKSIHGICPHQRINR